ncbi:argininosuccinate lyase [Agrobacterium salinitolerans]|uniref:argininosuccinate lyase n=1 Tax=Agrobacterium salinitolerans TaxID=1183413 RepID=UPI001C236723|nr:argininosuccinate lyase [Agrobacterium salinitolerans]QXC49017.1 argininosuccinate lyase [Agrobacterium salinitolerans]
MADMNPRLSDTSKFPDPVYKETVLRPLFDGAKNHHVDGFRRIDRAHLVMLRETGILDAETAAKIAGALEDIDRTIEPSELVYTGEVEDFFFLIEKELKARIGVDVAGRLHTARSRNDIDHTLFKIGEARRIVDLSPMGAAAITTSGFPIDRARVAELLGFAAPLRNSYSCIAAVDYTTATYGAIELMFLHLGRLIQDFQFWTSFEVGQIYVPNSLVQISSIMPQKRNPVPIEHLRHLASQTFGRARTVLDVMHNTPFTDMNDSEGETQSMGYEAFTSASRVLDLLASLVGQISIDPERVDQNIRRSCITITELADSLVRIEDLSFRQAHEIAATVAKSVVALKGDLPNDGYQPFLKAFRELAGRDTGIDEEKFKQIVSPEHFVAVRSRFGGPAPEPMREAIAAYRDRLGAFAAEARRFADHEAAKAAELAEKFTALTGAR